MTCIGIASRCQDHLGNDVLAGHQPCVAPQFIDSFGEFLWSHRSWRR
jgi:hypothetical protein